MSKNQKMETSYLFGPGEAAAYLRRLADQLESGTFDLERTEMELSDQIKVKESVKAKVGKRSVKIKVKLSGFDPSVGLVEEDEEEPETLVVVETEPETLEAEAELQEEPAQEPAMEPEAESKPRQPSYKRLKKKLGQNFKDLKAAVRDGQAPGDGLVQEFLEQCRTMITFPDKGEDYYPDFAKATEELDWALAGGSLAGAGAALEEMGRLRKNCHRRFK